MLILSRFFRNRKPININDNNIILQQKIEYQLLDQILQKQQYDISIMIENINRNNNNFVREFTYKMPNINFNDIKN